MKPHAAMGIVNRIITVSSVVRLSEVEIASYPNGDTITWMDHGHRAERLFAWSL
jgi:hypothetical protein